MELNNIYVYTQWNIVDLGGLGGFNPTPLNVFVLKKIQTTNYQ